MKIQLPVQSAFITDLVHVQALRVFVLVFEKCMEYSTRFCMSLMLRYFCLQIPSMGLFRLHILPDGRAIVRLDSSAFCHPDTIFRMRKLRHREFRETCPRLQS